MKQILLLSFLGLTACGTVQQAQINNAAEDIQFEIASTCYQMLYLSEKEALAWKQSRVALKVCEENVDGVWPLHQTIAISQCGEELLNKNVRPYSYSQEKFDEMLGERKKEHELYADGKLLWSELGRRANERVYNYFHSGDQGSYFTYANCSNNIISNKMYPVYPNQLKPVLNNYMTQLSKFSREADKSNMEIEDYKIGQQELWNEFVQQEQYAVNQANMRNAQAWQNYSRQMQQYSTDLMKIEKDSMPKNTNCTVVGNQMNCIAH
jgi:hypothetical protein